MCMQGGLAPLLCTLQCKDLIKALPRYQEIDSAVQGLQMLDMTFRCSGASFFSSHEPLANVRSQLPVSKKKPRSLCHPNIHGLVCVNVSYTQQ